MQDTEDIPLPEIEDTLQTERPRLPIPPIDVLRQAVQQYDDLVSAFDDAKKDFARSAFIIALYQDRHGPISLNMTKEEFNAAVEDKTVRIKAVNNPDTGTLSIETKVIPHDYFCIDAQWL